MVLKATYKTDARNDSYLPRVVFIESVRTPFLQSNGMFRELLSVDLQRHALLGKICNFIFLYMI